MINYKMIFDICSDFALLSMGMGFTLAGVVLALIALFDLVEKLK